jgi:hypothetical protein
MEEWSQQKLRFAQMYGIREYYRGAMLMKVRALDAHVHTHDAAVLGDACCYCLFHGSPVGTQSSLMRPCACCRFCKQSPPMSARDY